MHHRQALTKDVDPRRWLLIETEQSRSPVGMAGMTSLKKAEPHQHGDVGAKHDGVGSKFRGKLERRIGDDGAALLWHALAAQEVAASRDVARRYAMTGSTQYPRDGTAAGRWLPDAARQFLDRKQGAHGYRWRLIKIASANGA
jgi:hypothetical protein